MSENAPIDPMRFTFENVPPQERLDWFKVGSRTHRVSIPEGFGPQDLSADVTVWTVGRFAVLRSLLGPSVWERDAAHSREDGLDHIQFNLGMAGETRYRIAGRELTLDKGSVIAIDYTLPTRGVILDCFDSIVLTVPRDELARADIDLKALHGLELAGEARALVQHQIVSLVSYLQQVPSADAGRMVEATVQVLAACLPKGEAARRSSASDLDLGTLRRFIYENATRPDCDAAFLQSAFGISRATLYRLAAPLGGIGAFVLRCRLERARALIRADGSRISMVRISRMCGFKNPSHFARAFKERYGHPPSLLAGKATRCLSPGAAEELEAYAGSIEGIGGRPTMPRASAGCSLIGS